MYKLSRLTFIAGLVILVGACQKDVDKSKTGDDKEASTFTPPTSVKVEPRPPGTKPNQPANQIQPPMDVSAPPADALKSPSGMAYKVLAEGAGEKPGMNDTVLVNYTGWRENGQMFYTSTRRGTPQPMSLVQLSKGWEEALRDMTKGEKRIYWMPPELASRGRPAADSGMLVFEIELAEIQPAPETPADLKAPPADATKTKSGMAYKVLEKGSGADKPRDWDQVTMHYTIWNQEGRIVDSTTIRGRPRPTQVFREPAWWQEALKVMVQGEKARFWVPEANIEKMPTATEGGLVLDLELVALQQMPEPPPTPKDVAKPPADAKKTENGVFYKVLKKGTGTEHPTADKTVKVHYTGWTTDGNMFDSSITRGQPIQFPLRGVIAGWTEGVPTMVVGETTRFWIPEEMAYKGKPNRPQGMLVFDIELLEIMDAPQRPGHGAPTPGHGAMPKGHGGTPPNESTPEQ